MSAEYIQLLTSTLAVLGTLLGAVIPQYISKKMEKDKYHQEQNDRRKDDIIATTLEIDQIADKWRRIVEAFWVAEHPDARVQEFRSEGFFAEVLSASSNIKDHAKDFSEDHIKLETLGVKLSLLAGKDTYGAFKEFDDSLAALLASTAFHSEIEEAVSEFKKQRTVFLEKIGILVNN